MALSGSLQFEDNKVALWFTYVVTDYHLLTFWICYRNLEYVEE